ncbi:MAG: ATP-binding protein [Muribaculaceae bacterium]|nr:ATP-binding protein [Muribaculaceae bacterium]
MIRERNEIKYPVGIQSFSEIREGGYLYVDKTLYIHKLLTGKYYFLSRPRRFGKSLLLSTIEAYYQGRRDLFKGLEIESLTNDWDPHPVLHLDLNNGTYTKPTDLDILLDFHLKEWEKKYEVDSENDSPNMTASIRFGRIIKQAYEMTGKKAVILIDEYDKPLLKTLDEPQLTETYREILKGLYANLKTMDPYIKVAILTGVARFSKVSIFSDLNNLRDISFENEFSAICGVTADELDKYFFPGIEKVADNEGMTPEQARLELQRNYDGYHFSPISPDIYNPFSLVNAFAKGEMGDYWFRTGTPEFLVKLVRRANLPFKDIAPVDIHRNDLEDGGIFSPDCIPAFYQTGYLTIKDYDRSRKIFTLDYPNVEVKEGFLRFLLYSYMPFMQTDRSFSIFNFINEVRNGEAEGFMKRLESMIAGVPYSEKGSAESHFQNAIYLLFNLMGFYCRMEERTSDGRIDISVETDGYIFLFEFKVDSTPEAAINQIEEKKYWLPYRASAKKIFLIGANFDTKTRRLDPKPIIRQL